MWRQRSLDRPRLLLLFAVDPIAETFGDLGFGYHDGVAEKDFVVEFATALEPLPPIKKGKIVNKLRDVLKQIREKDEM